MAPGGGAAVLGETAPAADSDRPRCPDQPLPANGITLRGITGRDEHSVLAEEMGAQCRQALLNASRSLDSAGLSMSDVTRVVYLLRDADAFSSCFGLLRDAFGAARPAATLRLVDTLEAPEVAIELELTAQPRATAE